MNPLWIPPDRLPQTVNGWRTLCTHTSPEIDLVLEGGCIHGRPIRPRPQWLTEDYSALPTYQWVSDVFAGWIKAELVRGQVAAVHYWDFVTHLNDRRRAVLRGRDSSAWWPPEVVVTREMTAWTEAVLEMGAITVVSSYARRGSGAPVGTRGLEYLATPPVSNTRCVEGAVTTQECSVGRLVRVVP